MDAQATNELIAKYKTLIKEDAKRILRKCVKERKKINLEVERKMNPGYKPPRLFDEMDGLEHVFKTTCAETFFEIREECNDLGTERFSGYVEPKDDDQTGDIRDVPEAKEVTGTDARVCESKDQGRCIKDSGA